MIFLQNRSILHNTLLLTLANLALRSVSLLFQVYLADIIGAAGMGKMQLVLTAGGFAMTLGSSGIRVASMNLTAQEWGKGNPAGMRRAISACMTYSLILSTVAGALLWALAPKIALTFVKDRSVVPAIGLMALSLPVNCLVAVLSGFFTARGKIRPLVVIEVAERLLSIAVTVLLLTCWAGDDLSNICCSVIGGSSLSTLVSLVCMLVLLWRELRHIPKADLPIWKRLFSLCIPLALSDYLRSGLSTAEQFLIPRGLSKAHGSYDTSMADYGTISGMVFPILMFPAAVFYSLSDLLVPELSRCRVQGRTARIRHIVSRSLRVGAVFSGMVAGLMYLLAPSLGQILYASESAGRYLRTFSPLIVMLYLDALTDGMLKGLGEQVASVRYNTITAAMDVLLLWLLLPKWGLGGFFFSFTVTHAINFALSIGRLSDVTGFVPHTGHTLKTILIVLFSTALALRLAPANHSVLSMILCASVFLGIFLLLILLTGTLSKHDLRQFLPQAKTVPVRCGQVQ